MHKKRASNSEHPQTLQKTKVPPSVRRKNLKTQLYFCGSVHTNPSRKQSYPKLNLETAPSLRFSVDKNTLKTRRFEND